VLSVLQPRRGGRGRKGATCLTTAARIRPAFGPGNGPTMRPIGERVSGRILEPIREPFRAPKARSRNRLRARFFRPARSGRPHRTESQRSNSSRSRGCFASVCPRSSLGAAPAPPPSPCGREVPPEGTVHVVGVLLGERAPCHPQRLDSLQLRHPLAPRTPPRVLCRVAGRDSHRAQVRRLRRLPGRADVHRVGVGPQAKARRGLRPRREPPLTRGSSCRGVLRGCGVEGHLAADDGEHRSDAGTPHVPVDDSPQQYPSASSLTAPLAGLLYAPTLLRSRQDPSR
jgi:hypothetical protein